MAFAVFFFCCVVLYFDDFCIILQNPRCVHLVVAICVSPIGAVLEIQELAGEPRARTTAGNPLTLGDTQMATTKWTQRDHANLCKNQLNSEKIYKIHQQSAKINKHQQNSTKINKNQQHSSTFTQNQQTSSKTRKIQQNRM